MKDKLYRLRNSLDKVDVLVDSFKNLEIDEKTALIKELIEFGYILKQDIDIDLSIIKQALEQLKSGKSYESINNLLQPYLE